MHYYFNILFISLCKINHRENKLHVYLCVNSFININIHAKFHLSSAKKDSTLTSLKTVYLWLLLYTTFISRAFYYMHALPFNIIIENIQ